MIFGYPNQKVEHAAHLHVLFQPPKVGFGFGQYRTEHSYPLLIRREFWSSASHRGRLYLTFSIAVNQNRADKPMPTPEAEKRLIFSGWVQGQSNNRLRGVWLYPCGADKYMFSLVTVGEPNPQEIGILERGQRFPVENLVSMDLALKRGLKGPCLDEALNQVFASEKEAARQRLLTLVEKEQCPPQPS